MLPCPTPSRPSPDPNVLTKEIGTLRFQIGGNEICAINVHHTLVVPIADQHFRTKRKKALIREAIVFQEYRFLNQRKDPIDSRSRSFTAPQIDASIIRIHLARPVYVIRDHPSNGGDPVIIPRPVRPSTITNHE